MLEVVALLHLNEVVEKGFTVKVELVVYDAGGACCEEGVFFGCGTRGDDVAGGSGVFHLPFEERHGGFDGTHLVLLGGVEDEAFTLECGAGGGACYAAV